MTEKIISSTSITEQCYQYMIDNNIQKLNVYDFIDYIKPKLELSEEEFVSQMAYFYTDLNVDGRFVCVEDGSWMLKDNLSVEDVTNFVEPSIHKFEIDEDIDMEFIDDEDIIDEVDELLIDENDDNDDLYEYGESEIVSKYNISNEDDEF